MNRWVERNAGPVLLFLTLLAVGMALIAAWVVVHPSGNVPERTDTSVSPVEDQ